MLIVAAGIIVLGGAGAGVLLFGGSDSSLDAKLTHTIKREDLLVTVVEQGTLESSNNIEIKSKVRGQNTVIWVVPNGTYVEPGDTLVRLDTLEIEDAINERSKYAFWSRAGAESSAAQVRRARLAVDEYKKGRFVSQRMGLEKDEAIAESNLRTAKNMFRHASRMRERGYVSELEIDQREFAIKQAMLSLEVIRTDIKVLKDYTKKMELNSLEGDLNAISATHDANEQRAVLDETRRDQALEELKHCEVKAESAGLVIYPSAAAWKEAPDIAEGATVHKDQTLLLMPDLTTMQVKVGVHESVIDRMSTGLECRVELPDLELTASVTSVASVARPAGWWTGNVVKYDTIIELPSVEGLKPGMSAAVEIVLAKHRDVLTIPVSAVLETEDATVCWVQSENGIVRRAIELGDSNDVFIVVTDGLQEGDEVILNPVTNVEEAKNEALQSVGESSRSTDGQESPNVEPTPVTQPLPQVP